MMKRTLIVLSITVTLLGAVMPLQSVRGILISPEELAAVNSSSAPAAASEKQESSGNGLVRALKAPFKAIGRFFGRGKKAGNKLERMSEKDISNFESTPVDQIKDATMAPTANSNGLSQAADLKVSANDHLEKGRSLLNNRHLNEAITSLSLATSTDPCLTEAHNLLGVAYQLKRLPDMARRSFEAALKIDKKNLQTLNNLGYLLSSTGDYKGALSFLKRAARLAPDDPLVLNNLAMAQSQLGKFDEASKNFVRAGGEIKGRLNAANQLQFAGLFEEAQKQFELAKLRAEAEQKSDASVQAITVIVEVKNGRVTYASVPNRRPGWEAYEASALRVARQVRFAIHKNGPESIVVKVSPPPAS